MRKIALRIMIGLTIVLLLCSVNPLVDALYQYKFEKFVKPNASHFSLLEYYSPSRIQSDKDFMYGIFGFISLLLLAFVWSQEKLIAIKRLPASPSQGDLSLIFFTRCMLLLFGFAALMVSTVVFEAVFSHFNTSSNFFAAVVILFIINVMIFVPYTACIGIYKGLKLITAVKFCLGTTVILGICMALNMTQFAAAGVAALLSSFGFAKTMFAEFKGLEAFLGIKGKGIAEMFLSTAPARYQNVIPQTPEAPVQTAHTPVQIIRPPAATEDLEKLNVKTFYAPKEKPIVFLFAFGFIAIFLSFISFQLIDFKKFEPAPFMFVGFALVSWLFFVLVFKNRSNALLLSIDDRGFRCVDTNFLETATTNNQLNVLFRLYLFPKYRYFLFTDIRRFEIEYETSIGPVIVLFPRNESKRGLVFYFNSEYTPDLICNLLIQRKNGALEK
jgi:hypothetical protein